MRKHRLAERLLADVIGLDWEYVHDEACRWEHVMSEQVERRLIEMLGHPTESPYGNPIPGLDELGDPPAGRFIEGVVNVVDARRRGRRAGDRRRPPARRARAVRSRAARAAEARPASCPAPSRRSRAAGGYVLVQVDGHGDGLELPARGRQPRVRRRLTLAQPAPPPRRKCENALMRGEPM